MMKLTGNLVSVVAIMAVLLSNGVQCWTSVTVKCELRAGTSSSKQYCYVPGSTADDNFKAELLTDHSRDARCKNANFKVVKLEGKVFLELSTVGCRGSFTLTKVGSSPDPPASKIGCGINKGGRRFRIIGGHYASKCQYPWMVFIRSTVVGGNQFYVCGGSIIDNKHILTASHCLIHGRQWYPAGNIKIFSGTMQRFGGIERGVEKIFTHENYDIADFHNDIAIVRLRNAIRFDDCQSPICLTGDTTITPGKSCRVMGWGYISIQTGQYPNTLKWIEDPMASDADCKSKYHNLWDKGSVCGQATSYCQGDSGGPLACLGRDNKYYQHGIVSIHLTNQMCKGAGKYTLVPYFKSWIDKTLRRR